MWTLREAQIEPSYYDRQDSRLLMTIKMHHGGKFEEKYSRYVDGRVSLFDFYAVATLTIDALHLMAATLGYESSDDQTIFLVSKSGGCDSCIDLEYLIMDSDVRNLSAFLNSERVVGVFIEHFTHGLECKTQIGSTDEVDVGYDVDDDRIDINGIQSETKVEVGSMSNAFDMFEIDSQTDQDSNIDESDGNDSVFTDGFEESDFELDDALFNENIDPEVECCGFKDVKVSQPPLETNFQHNFVTKKNSKVSKVPKTYGVSKFPIYNGNAADSDFEFETGLCFSSATEFRDAVRTYSIKQGKPLKFIKNCSNKVRVRCNCGWVVYASYKSKNDRTFQIKTIDGEHSCYREPSTKHCTSKVLATKYKHHLRSNPLWPINSMQEIMLMENHTDLSRSKMYRTKKKVSLLSNGTEIEQYSRLRDYCEEEGTKYNCSNCGKPGHNKKGCKEGKIKKESVPRETKESQQSEINMN